MSVPWSDKKFANSPKNVWGPAGWYWLHLRAINYPNEPDHDRRIAEQSLFWKFIQELPCYECRKHAMEYMRTYSPDFSGSIGYQTWAWRFHNAVNSRLNKPIMNAEQYRQTYMVEIAQSRSFPIY